MARQNSNIKGFQMTEQKKSLMKQIEALDEIPQTERDELHEGRLYPETLDRAIIKEEPLTYSRAKIIKILMEEVADELEIIEELVDEMTSDKRNKFKII